jgi:hypothetical protein
MTISALALVLLLGAARAGLAQKSEKAGAAPADEMKPLVVVAFSGYDKVIDVLKSVGKLANTPLAEMAEAGLRSQTEGHGLDGLDTKRPWGMTIHSDGQNFPIVGFVPVTDLKKLLDALKPHLGNVAEKEKVYSIDTKDGHTVYATEKDGWAFISGDAEHLADVPKEPLKVLDDLPNAYDLAVRLSAKNVPPLFRQMFLTSLQMGVQRGAERKPDESDEQFALREKLTKQAMDELQRAIDDLDTIQVGLKVDPAGPRAYFDVEVLAKEGSKTGKDASQVKPVPSGFTGFFDPQAAISANVATTRPNAAPAIDQTIAAARANVVTQLEKQDLSEADKKRAKQWINDLMDVAQKTLETGRVDMGLTVALQPDALTFTAGAYLADAAKVDAVIHQAVPELRKENPEVGDFIKLDAETYQGIKFHTIAVPLSRLPGDTGDLAKLTGDTVEVAVGIGPESVYLAVGRRPLETVKRLIDKSKSSSPQPVPPARFSIALRPIAKTMAVYAKENRAKEVAAKVGKVLEAEAGKDTIRITSTVVHNGSRVRIEIDRGVLKLLGSLPTFAAGGE